jgi:hypothetical protein
LIARREPAAGFFCRLAGGVSNITAAFGAVGTVQ